MKNKKIMGLCLGLCVCMSVAGLTGCGDKDKTVEDQVAEALAEDGAEALAEDGAEVERDIEQLEENDANDGDADGTTEGAGVNSTGESETSVAGNSEELSTNAKQPTGPVYGVNPFLGDESKATSYDIKFTIETDSGIAGFTWGSTDGTKGEYYLVAFDCTRDIPRLYTCRRNGNDIYDEVYTNLDFMYPEMDMFTKIPHYIEIKVNDTKATVYLDSYTVTDVALNHATVAGQIGTWVMKGDYHAYFDDITVIEGVDGAGDWIYSEAFAEKTSIFSPKLKTEKGRLYAKSGYYTVPKTELMREKK